MAAAALPVPTGANIAADALKYVGLGYAYGGDASAPGVWDCSSYVSYVLSHDFGLALPGGGGYGNSGYPPSAHGPVVLDYATWDAATTLPAGQAPQAGDLCVWAGVGPLGHVGIATDSLNMVSALDSSMGTVHTPIAGYGPAGAKLSYRRITNVTYSATTTSWIPGVDTLTNAATALLAGATIGALAPLALAGLVIGGALLVGAVGAGAVLLALGAAQGGGE